MAESSEQKYDRLQREIQDAVLKGFPNPERKGCPGRTVVENYAKNPDQITAGDDVNPASQWYHITHCSPCYAEFLDLRTEYRVKRVRARMTRRTAILSSLAGAGEAGWLLSRNRTRTVEIDFERYMSTRGVEGPAALTMPVGKLHVELKLPKDSAEGLYTVQLSKEPDSKPIFSQVVNATADRALKFEAEIKADPGNYVWAVRNDHRGVWRYSPVLLQAR